LDGLRYRAISVSGKRVAIVGEQTNTGRKQVRRPSPKLEGRWSSSRCLASSTGERKRESYLRPWRSTFRFSIMIPARRSECPRRRGDRIRGHVCSWHHQRTLDAHLDTAIVTKCAVEARDEGFHSDSAALPDALINLAIKDAIAREESSCRKCFPETTSWPSRSRAFSK
jgi:hypothetical protein